MWLVFLYRVFFRRNTLDLESQGRGSIIYVENIHELIRLFQGCLQVQKKDYTQMNTYGERYLMGMLQEGWAWRHLSGEAGGDEWVDWWGRPLYNSHSIVMLLTYMFMNDVKNQDKK